MNVINLNIALTQKTGSSSKPVIAHCMVNEAKVALN